MTCFKKKIFTMALVLVMVLTNTSIVSAAEPQVEAVYDLEKGGIQTFLVEGADGEIQTITIEEVVNDARVADDTYKISCETLNWEAGFYIKVSNNQITSAYSPFHTALRGSIQDSILLRNSSVKVTYSFIYKLTVFKFDTGVMATISNSSLKVSQI